MYNLLKSFKMGFNTETREKEITEVINLFPNSRGQLESINFKSFRGLIKEIKKANTYCRKYKFETEIRFKLPIHW